MEERTDLSAVVDLARARMERLEAEELRTLAAATGNHLPPELAQLSSGCGPSASCWRAATRASSHCWGEK